MKQQKLVFAWKMMLLIAGLILFSGCRPAEVMASAKGIGVYSVKVDGYLALRNAKAYDASNEIGKLYTGDTVVHLESANDSADYWYVYSYEEEQAGYVNKDYLEYEGMLQNGTYCEVMVDGYLAIRTAKAYDASNEIGKLYTGDSVLVLNDSDTEYWFIYCLDKMQAGYVNKNYLRDESTSSASVYTDNSVGGISSNLKCDMDRMIFSTKYISFLIPDSWGKGITYNYYEDRIDFYCTAVKEAPGLEDGFLCSVYRSTGSASDYEGSDSLGYSDGYYYFLRTPTDLRANPNDKGPYEAFQQMSSEVSEVRNSIVIISQ